MDSTRSLKTFGFNYESLTNIYDSAYQNLDHTKSPLRDNQNPFNSGNTTEFITLMKENQILIFYYGSFILTALLGAFIHKIFRGMYENLFPLKASTIFISRNYKLIHSVRSHLKKVPNSNTARYLFSSNLQKYVILCSFSASLFVFIYKLSIVSLFLVAYKSGSLSMVYITMLYIIPLKNFPLRYLIHKYSYETYLIYHKWTGIMTCFFLVVHIGSFIRVLNWWYILSDFVCQMGLFLFFGFTLIFLSSITKFRTNYYEIFKFIHYLFYWACLIPLYLHVGSPIYKAVVVVLSLVLIVNKAITLKKTWILDATFEFQTGSDFVSISIKRDSKYFGQKFDYKLSNHIYLTIPAISCFQSHPFSMISAPSLDKDTVQVLIKRQNGFTEKLFQYLESLVKLESSTIHNILLQVIIDGPYGNTHMRLPYREIISNIDEDIQEDRTQDIVCGISSFSMDNEIFNETHPLIESHTFLNNVNPILMDIERDPVGIIRETFLKSKIILIAGGSGIAFVLPIFKSYNKFLSQLNAPINVGYQGTNTKNNTDTMIADNLRLIWIMRNKSHLDLRVFRALKDNRNVKMIITQEAGRVKIPEIMNDEMKHVDTQQKVSIIGCGASSMVNEIRVDVDEKLERGYQIECLIEEFNW